MDKNKDFIKWSRVKGKVNLRNRPFFSEREVWWCYLGENIGSEQDGRGDFYLRPVIILKRINVKVAFCVPLTTQLKHDISHVAFYFDYNLNTAILAQVKVIDSKRLLKYKGKISDYLLVKIKKALRSYLLA